MKISSEFSKYAASYGSQNVIQDMVASKLVELVTSKPQRILDLGCGNGAICKKIDWEYEYFKGIDFAPGMLELHPKSEKIESAYGDFNDKTLFNELSNSKYDYIFSASALQWATDLDAVFEGISSLNTPVVLGIFTSNTFKTLNETASLPPMLRTSQEIDKVQKKHFNADFELVSYRLEFESTREMFRYIKQSGVSGSRKVLDYKQTKQLMREYPLNYLEFEVAFIHSH